jgi:glycosyltransferase involved in cell wall biosynthesis
MVSSPMTQSSQDDVSHGTFVSIVIPVYNTPRHLIKRAVVSVLEQTHRHLEVLIVDDGSLPDIAIYLDSIAELDPRIRVLHQANGGVSAARNAGIKHAAGVFIAYLDADDYLESTFLSEASALATTTGADAVFGGIRVLRSDGTANWRADGLPVSRANTSTPAENIDACILALSYSPSNRDSTPQLAVTNIVSCLYTIDIARNHRFLEGMAHAEDRLHNVRVILDASLVVFCSNIWYAYDTTHSESATRRANTRTVAGLIRTVQEYAALSKELLEEQALSISDRARIAQAAADGTFSYTKVLSGVMASVGEAGDNRRQLHQLLSEPSVGTAMDRAQASGWQNKLFAFAARRRQIRGLLVLGALWTRTQGYRMSSEEQARPARRKEQRND